MLNINEAVEEYLNAFKQVAGSMGKTATTAMEHPNAFAGQIKGHEYGTNLAKRIGFGQTGQANLGHVGQHIGNLIGHAKDNPIPTGMIAAGGGAMLASNYIDKKNRR